nr:nuclear transport factor 2 family protein [uncultured Glaciecola sp.]
MNAITKFQSFYTDLASMKIEELADLYSKDVTFVDPVAAHSGITAVEAYFTKLLHNAKYCSFTIHSLEQTISIPTESESKNTTDGSNYLVTWKMSFTSARINKGHPIHVDGVSQLKVKNDKITYHRDYYDLGQMIYENIPLLGRLIKRIKRTLG